MIAIRRAGDADLDAVHRLETRCFDLDAQSRRSLRHLLSRANGAVFLAEVDGEVRGYAALLFRRNTRSARLYSIAVAPEARGAGIARALLTAVETAARQCCVRLRAEVRRSNEASRKLLAAAGYREVAVLAGYYPGGEAGIRLQKDLGPSGG